MTTTQGATNFVRDARDALKLTRAELAARAGVSLSTISRLEHGKHAPDDITLYALADALGVDATDLRNSLPAQVRRGTRRGAA